MARCPATLCATLILALATGSACGREKHTEATNVAQKKVEDLAARLAGGGVAKVRILHVPARVLTRTRLTPEMLERQFQYELTIRDIRGNTYEKRLGELAKSTSVEPQPDMPDLRWGIIFYDPSGDAITALYFNSSGSQGAVGDLPVSFSGGLFAWLKENFSGSLR